MSRWPGMSVQSLKKHYELIPLFGAVGAGFVLCGAYLLRLATLNPDVSWNKKSNPEPWNKFKQTDGYKAFSTRNHKEMQFPPERPDMSNNLYKNI